MTEKTQTASKRRDDSSSSPDAVDRTRSAPATTSESELVDLQHIVGNKAVIRLLAPESSGSPLDSDLQANMQHRFQHDFSRVRVHADGGAAEAARAFQAKAFVFGHHIVMGAGEYRPHDPGGRRLIAHELAHVIQQSQVADHPETAALDHNSPHLEAEAREAAGEGGHAASLSKTHAPAIQRVGFFEAIARFFGGGTFPPEELVSYLDTLRRTKQIEDHYDSDNKARDVVRRGKEGDPRFQGFTVEIRSLLVREMLTGYVSGADENAILDILREAPPNEAEKLIEMVGEGELRRRFSGDNLKLLLDLLEGVELASEPPERWSIARMTTILRHEGRQQVLSEIATAGYTIWSFETAFDKYRYPDGSVLEEQVTGLAGNTDRPGKKIRLSRYLSDDDAVAHLIHEWTHGSRPASTTQEQVEDQEIAARVAEEQYRINRGLPPQEPSYRKPDGTIDEAYIRAQISTPGGHYHPVGRHKVGARRWVGEHQAPGFPPVVAP